MKRKSRRRPKRKEAGLVLEVGGLRVIEVSEAQYQRERRAEKAKLRIFDWEDVEKLVFPNYFTMHMDYLATGEGCTRRLTFCYAEDAKALRRMADGDFGAYFAHAVESREGLNPLPGYDGMVPETVKEVVRSITEARDRAPANFHFTTQLHLNYS